MLLNIVPLSSVDGSLPHIRPQVMIYFIEVFILSRKKFQSSMKDDIDTVVKNLKLKMGHGSLAHPLSKVMRGFGPQSLTNILKRSLEYYPDNEMYRTNALFRS